MNDQNKGTLIEPTRITLGQWLLEWIAKVIKPNKTPRTYATYKGVLDNHLVPSLGAIRLQELRPMHLETYNHEHRQTLAPATLEQHHMIVHGALEAAVRNGLVPRNVAKLVSGKPRAPESRAEDVALHCWTADEARRFLDAAKAAGDQPAAFYALALETGMRKSELGGLQWRDVDLTRREVGIQRQLVTVRPAITFGPLKNKKSRKVHITLETAALLKCHKAHQGEVRLQAGARYHDHGLVFAKEWGGTDEHLGEPLALNTIGQREFARLIKAAGVRRIKFHGMRHTSATLALQEGRPVKMVQTRLGHAKAATTLDVYAHCMPDQDQETADTLGALLHGGKL